MIDLTHMTVILILGSLVMWNFGGLKLPVAVVLVFVLTMISQGVLIYVGG